MASVFDTLRKSKWGQYIGGAAAIGGLFCAASKLTTGQWPWEGSAASASSSSTSSEEKKGAVTSLQLPYRDSSGARDLNAGDLWNKKTLDDVCVEGKRVLMRTDYNVELKEGGVEVVGDTLRVDQTVDSIKYILNKKGPNGGSLHVLQCPCRRHSFFTRSNSE